MIDWLKQRVLAASLSAAVMLILVQTILPSVFDFIFDLMLIALIWVVGVVTKAKRS
jgi:hypothetical protein